MFLLVSVLFAFVFGSIIGSFLNVVIHRVPRGESVVFPGSKCPTCSNSIAWYDNIPIVSWIALGAQCRHCKTPISGRYAAVEALVGLLSALLWAKLATPMLHGVSHWAMLDMQQLFIPFFMYFTFIALSVSIAFIDLELFIIPHSLSIPGILLGLASPWVIGYLFSTQELLHLWPPITPTISFMGALFGAVSIIAIFLIYLLLRGVPGMGGGDVTLMAMMGAWLGWPALLFIFFAASIQGLMAAGLTTVLGINFVKDAKEVLDEDPVASHDDAEQHEEDKPLNDDAATDLEKDEDATSKEDEEEDDDEEFGAAIPFGPFIVLAGLEHFFFGPFLPDTISMLYMYIY